MKDVERTSLRLLPTINCELFIVLICINQVGSGDSYLYFQHSGGRDMQLSVSVKLALPTK